MVEQFFGVVARLRPHPAPSPYDMDVALKGRTLLMSVVGLVVFCLLLLNVGVLAIARMEPIRQVLDLPQSYLPGQIPPDDLRCEPSMVTIDPSTVAIPRCFVHFQGHVVFLDFDYDERTIIRSMIPARHYSLGQLIVSWGTPIGINWNRYTIYVYWQTRWVIMDNESFRPHSHIQSILYTPFQPPYSPWRGFRQG